MNLQSGSRILHKGKAVARLGKRQAGSSGNFLDGELGILRVGIDPGADSVSAESDLIQPLSRLPDAFTCICKALRVAGKFLSHANRDGILQMCAPGLDDPHKLLGLCPQHFYRTVQRRQELVLDQLCTG